MTKQVPDPERPESVLVGPFAEYEDASTYCIVQHAHGVQMDQDCQYWVYGPARQITKRDGGVNPQLSLF